MSIAHNLHQVGHHLQITAIAATAEEKDAFARSAFNRYYYGAFLNVRAMLVALDDKWSSLNHSSIPEVLRGDIKRTISNERKRAQKNGDWELERKLETTKRAIDQLAETMNMAYAIRKIADYHPDEPVSFDPPSRFKLRSIDISDAHDWEATTKTLCESVSRAWAEIHG